MSFCICTVLLSLCICMLKNKKVKKRKERKKKKEWKKDSITAQKIKGEGKKGVGEKGRRSPQKRKRKKLKKEKSEEKNKIKNGITTQKIKREKKGNGRSPDKTVRMASLLRKNLLLFSHLSSKRYVSGALKNRFIQTNGKCNNALMGRGYFLKSASIDLIQTVSSRFDPNRCWISIRYWLVYHHTKLGSGQPFDVWAINWIRCIFQGKLLFSKNLAQNHI